MCCTLLAGNTGRKNRHFGTIAQLCRAVSSQLRHVSTIGKKLVKHRHLLNMSSWYGELWPTNGWDLLASLGHPCKFQRLSRLGGVTVQHSSSGRQPNFAALNRGRHLYLARPPSRWTLAHILVYDDMRKEKIYFSTCGLLTIARRQQRQWETTYRHVKRKSRNHLVELYAHSINPHL